MQTLLVYVQSLSNPDVIKIFSLLHYALPSSCMWGFSFSSSVPNPSQPPSSFLDKKLPIPPTLLLVTFIPFSQTLI